MRKKIITAASVICALLLIGCGAASKEDTIQPAAPAGSGSGVVGAVAATTGAAAPAGPTKFKAGEVGTLALANGSTADVVVNTAKIQGAAIVVSVTITCKAGSIDYNVFDWSMLSGDGTKLDVGFEVGVKNQLSSGTIAAPQRVTGNLVFEGTKAQMAGGQVQFAPNFKIVAYWVV